jgi:pimeloyl-ACP methyl ester carboxylesterase
MATLPSNGLSFDVEVHGEPDAPVLLLVMGLGMPAALWPDEFVAALVQAGFRVVTFDNRDCGGSTRLEGVPTPDVRRAILRSLLRRRVTGPYTLDDMAADTVGLLDALGVERAHVVGASMGGMIGQMVAARYPARVASLTSIMSNSGNPARRYAFGKWKALRAITHPPPPPDDHVAVVEHLVRVFGVIGSPGFQADLPLLRPILERVARRGLYRAGTERQLLAILSTGDRRTMLAAITAPTLVLHGADDPLVPPAAGRDTAACIPGARLEMVEGMGHDFPPALMARVAVRIAEHCRAAAPTVPIRAAEPTTDAAPTVAPADAVATAPAATSPLPAPVATSTPAPSA